MFEVYDIETLKCFFSYIGLNIGDSKKVNTFMICRHQNDLESLVKHLNSLQGQIGYNNLSFDSQVIQYILNHYKEWLELDGHTIAGIIYKYAQHCIELANKQAFSDYPEWKLTIKQLDLFKIWHFNNRAKMTSLKWVEYSMDFPNIEEMSIEHDVEEITEQQIKDVLGYNLNDVMATYEFYLITLGQTNHPLYKGIDRIELRKNIRNEFKINCINYNDVKIGDELNKSGYLRRSGKNKYKIKPKSVNKDFTFGDCIPDYVVFKTDKFTNFLNSIKNVKVKIEKDESKVKKKQEFILEHNGTIYSIMKGGIHSHDNARIIEPLVHELLIDADIGSQYPNAIRKRKLFPPHLGEEWLIQYIDTIKRRLEAKSLYKQTKDAKYQAIQEAYKLALNGGGFGKLGEETSWQYNPFTAMCVTIGNQFEILMLIEALELEEIHVVSANTDGILSLFDGKKEKRYYEICKEWELKVGNEDLGQLEYVEYIKFIQTSVNDYIAIKTKDNSIKTKGDFVSEFEIHKNKSASIIPIALQQYYSKGIAIEDTIMNHKNIFDFCLGVKSIGSNRLLHLEPIKGTEIKLQKVNRYYISTNGWHLLKRLPALTGKRFAKQMDIFGEENNGERESEIEAGWLTTIYNKHIEKEIKDYSIDYSYYINKANKIIDNINGTGM